MSSNIVRTGFYTETDFNAHAFKYRNWRLLWVFRAKLHKYSKGWHYKLPSCSRYWEGKSAVTSSLKLIFRHCGSLVESEWCKIQSISLNLFSIQKKRKTIVSDLTQGCSHNGHSGKPRYLTENVKKLERNHHPSLIPSLWNPLTTKMNISENILNDNCWHLMFSK